MTETAWRLVLVGLVTASAFAFVGTSFLRRWLRARRAASGPLDLSGIADRVLLFSEASCPSCDVARLRLDGSGIDYREVRYEDDPEVHRNAGVTAVPLVVVRTADGEITGRIGGRPPIRTLNRLFRRSGVK